MSTNKLRISRESLDLDDMDELISELNPSSQCGKSLAGFDNNHQDMRGTMGTSEHGNSKEAATERKN